MNQHYIVLYIFLLDIITLTTCMIHAEHTITVYVHETFPLRKFVHHTPFKALIYAEQGLSLAKNLPSYYHFYQIAQGCIALDHHEYSWDRFYIFGWESEKIFDSHRKKSAYTLIQSLTKIIQEYYAKHTVYPHIRFIGYSHGGNVILHAAELLPLLVNNQLITCEAWLFGTPIQQSNHDNVNHNKFTKCYSFYSESDIIQRIDPQGLINPKLIKTHFWSDRTFHKNAQCVQVKLTVNHKHIGHLSYRTLLKKFPLLAKITEKKAQGSTCGHISINFKI